MSASWQLLKPDFCPPTDWETAAIFFLIITFPKNDFQILEKDTPWVVGDIHTFLKDRGRIYNYKTFLVNALRKRIRGLSSGVNWNKTVNPFDNSPWAFLEENSKAGCSHPWTRLQLLEDLQVWSSLWVGMQCSCWVFAVLTFAIGFAFVFWFGKF